MGPIQRGFLKVAACGSKHNPDKKKKKGMLIREKISQEYMPPAAEDEHPLVTQYRDMVRKQELMGTGAGVLGGGLLGRLIGKGAKSRNLIYPLLGATGAGLLGKHFGRRAGESRGAGMLTEQTGIPWEVQ